MFFTPKAYVKIDFKCPHADISPEAEVLTEIFTRLLMDYLNEYGKLFQVDEVFGLFFLSFFLFLYCSVGLNFCQFF